MMLLRGSVGEVLESGRVKGGGGFGVEAGLELGFWRKMPGPGVSDSPPPVQTLGPARWRLRSEVPIQDASFERHLHCQI